MRNYFVFLFWEAAYLLKTYDDIMRQMTCNRTNVVTFLPVASTEDVHTPTPGTQYTGGMGAKILVVVLGPFFPAVLLLFFSISLSCSFFPFLTDNTQRCQLPA